MLRYNVAKATIAMMSTIVVTLPSCQTATLRRRQGPLEVGRGELQSTSDREVA